MKTKLILLFAFVVYSFAPILANNAKNDTQYHEKENTLKTAENNLKTGYHVLIKKGIDISELKTESLAEVYLLIEINYPGSCFDIESELNYSPFFRFEAYNKHIYVEKMRITKKGKYKRLKKS